ncbi:helix-turn-helix domain-containing protein [Natronococcus jeotgali]|uniref:Transcriptional regulator n=1 Tax=Natronococcus jeotgali DSM 18795 TaxID=1227498 RepID=L9XLE5_9EURY|nr:helix-turn-helix domain-containing protein [Natronococcus jeotgali]ELY62599.1 transcriptional regulator [Natronococcus jeotgali DSM 18795]
MSHTPPATEGQDAQQFFAVAETLAEESRRDIVADIVAHPEGLPSMKELEFTTGLHRTTIHQHLEALIDGGIVEPVEIPPGQRTKGQPSKFYAISDTARQIFDQNNVFIEDHWKEIYDRVEKPEEIQEAEAAPRPDQD